MDFDGCVEDGAFTVNCLADIREVVDSLKKNYPGIRKLVIDAKGVGDVRRKKITLSEMEALASLTSLVELDLRNCSPAHHKVLECLANSNLTNLEILDVCNFKVGHMGARALANGMTNLTSLTLSSNSIGNEGVEALASGNLTNLTELILHNCSIGNEGVEALAKSNLINLTSLILDNNNIGNEGVEALAKGNLVNLEHLQLDNNNDIGDRGARALANGNLINLEYFALCCNQIGPEGVSALARSVMTRLDELHLRDNEVGDGGAFALANGNLKNLRHLTLSNSEIGMQGVQILARGNLSGLFSLNLSHNDIGDDGAKALAQGNLTNLIELNLAACDISDIGIESIIYGKEDEHLPSLKMLTYFSDTSLDGKAKLNSISDCAISRLRSVGIGNMVPYQGSVGTSHRCYQANVATSSGFGESYGESAMALPRHTQVSTRASESVGQADNRPNSNFSLYQHHPAGAVASHSYGALRGSSGSQHGPNSNFSQYAQKGSKASSNLSKVTKKTAHKLKNRTLYNLYPSQATMGTSGSASQVDNQHSHYQSYQGSAEASSSYQHRPAGAAASHSYGALRGSSGSQYDPNSNSNSHYHQAGVSVSSDRGGPYEGIMHKSKADGADRENLNTPDPYEVLRNQDRALAETPALFQFDSWETSQSVNQGGVVQYSGSKDRVTDTPMTAFSRRFGNINPGSFPSNEDVEKQLSSLSDHDMEILQPVDQCNSGLDPNSNRQFYPVASGSKDLSHGGPSNPAYQQNVSTHSGPYLMHGGSRMARQDPCSNRMGARSQPSLESQHGPIRVGGDGEWAPLLPAMHSLQKMRALFGGVDVNAQAAASHSYGALQGSSGSQYDPNSNSSYGRSYGEGAVALPGYSQMSMEASESVGRADHLPDSRLSDINVHKSGVNR
ncbi:hypothetical protein [Wolbachia endosymbiont of Armadillidium arcangelii]|uniref:Uncharacterized protein n=1 Tax=Wolbachia endosymbiont of Armadillidium arcangelii TaxID=3158571 RepID=A0AAU7Q1S1_9RICK